MGPRFFCALAGRGSACYDRRMAAVGERLVRCFDPRRRPLFDLQPHDQQPHDSQPHDQRQGSQDAV